MTPTHGNTEDDSTQTEDGVLLPFPRKPLDNQESAEVEPAETPLEGEIVTPEEFAEHKALQRRTPVTVVVHVVRVVVTGEKTATAGRATLRAGMTIGQGLGSWVRRGWDAATLGVYRAEIAAARAAGDQERLVDWTIRREQTKKERHQRWMDAPKLMVGAVLVVGIGLASVVAIVLMVGLIAQASGAGEFMAVIDSVMGVIRWTFDAVPVAARIMMFVGPVALGFAAWREGRRHLQLPDWLATAADGDLDVTIDETTIAAALAALRIPQIKDHFKQGMPLQYLTQARRDGRGTHAVIRLPSGVTAEKIARRRADLATGLHRLAKEVWPTTGSEAGILDLWIADKGALAEGAGPHPLLTEGTVDVFRGVPFGKTLRGEPVVAPVMERNTIVGGIPGQGKSAAARVIMTGAALDPTAELRIWIPDSNYDFEVFKPRLSRYVMGAEDEKIEEILHQLRELHAEVQARGELLIRFEEPQVTRALASQDVGLHPLFCLLEEAHVAIQHEKCGPAIAQLLIDIVRLGRKRAIHMIVSTQAPTKNSIPRDVTRNCSNGIAFAVGDHVANDALLGQGAYAGGHRATELIPGTDIGTAVAKGFSGARSAMIQAYFLSVSKTNDQVTPIIERSLAVIADRGRNVPGSLTVFEQPEDRDLLEDLDEVLGDVPVPVADVPALLSRLAPRWMPYRALTGKALRKVLGEEYGIKVPSTGNRWPLDPVTVREALALRSTADLDDECGE